MFGTLDTAEASDCMVDQEGNSSRIKAEDQQFEATVPSCCTLAVNTGKIRPLCTSRAHRRYKHRDTHQGGQTWIQFKPLEIIVDNECYLLADGIIFFSFSPETPKLFIVYQKYSMSSTGTKINDKKGILTNIELM